MLIQINTLSQNITTVSFLQPSKVYKHAYFYMLAFSIKFDSVSTMRTLSLSFSTKLYTGRYLLSRYLNKRQVTPTHKYCYHYQYFVIGTE